MADVFEVQDEIARKIAEALRVTLSPQEQEALAAKPTENLQAYDLYLRGKSYARRLTRQDLEFALQMFENAVAPRPRLRPRLRRHRQRLRPVPLALRARAGLDRSAADGRQPEGERPRPRLARGPGGARPGSSTPRGSTTRPSAGSARRSSGKPDCRGRLLPPAAGRSSPPGSYQEVARHRRGRGRSARRGLQRLRAHPSTRSGPSGRRRRSASVRQRGSRRSRRTSGQVPEDARARTLLATDYASLERVEDALREANLAMAAAAQRRRS